MSKFVAMCLLIITWQAVGILYGKTRNTKYELKICYSNFKTPYRSHSTETNADSDATKYDGFVYFKQKDSAVDIVYYALFDTSHLCLFGNIKRRRSTDGIGSLLCDSTPVFIKYQSENYAIKIPVFSASKSVPTTLYRRSADGFDYVLIREDVVSWTTAMPLLMYIILKFQGNKLTSYQYIETRQEISFETALVELSRVRKK